MEYRVIRSGRKTLAMEITRDGELLIRAPRWCSLDAIEEFVKSHEGWIASRMARREARNEAYPEPDEALEKELVAMAKAVLPERVAYFSSVMGLVPTGVKITGAKTLFGSCSAKNSLCFSWRLMRYPDAAIDYVVVHELAHIAEKNHGKGFYAVVGSVMPDWKERKKLLR